jgi:microcin C transport system substrate-binding protein
MAKLLAMTDSVFLLPGLRRMGVGLAIWIFGLSTAVAQDSFGPWSRSMALGGEPKYAAGFKHFDYVSGQPQLGGELRLAAMGGFDKLNPFTLKGLSARGLMELVFEPLAIASLDEPMSMYGLLASEMRLASDAMAIEFRLDGKARFSNGKPVTAQDVKFSFDTLRGPLASPIWKNYWADVKAVVVVDERTVRFEFLRRNRELHMIVASLPVFSRDWIPADKTFDQVVQELPIGSGPYVVEKFDLGKRITYLRQSDYWAAQKPSRAGQFNFQRISFQYYKDVFARLEALKAGEFDFIHENTAKNWARSYKGRPFDSGSLIKTEMPTSNAAGLQAFYFNLRRPVFQDVRVRRAIELAMDFEWMNRQLFYNQYRRSDSYFTNTEMAAVGAPNPSEVSLLKALSAKTGRALPPELLGPVPTPASTAAPSSLRDNLRQARALLTEAGYQLVDGRLVNDKGQPLQFEILISQKSWERVIAPFARNLAKLGIEARSRVTDNSLYKKRLDDYDYDMVVHWYLSSQNPGNELLFRFTSQSAKQPGADNYIGIADPLVDAAITSVISARNRSDMVLAAKVLDRLLRHGHYAIAHWHNNVHRVAYRQGLQGPKKPPLYYHSEDWVMATWWWSQKGPQ